MEVILSDLIPLGKVDLSAGGHLTGNLSHSKMEKLKSTFIHVFWTLALPHAEAVMIGNRKGLVLCSIHTSCFSPLSLQDLATLSCFLLWLFLLLLLCYFFFFFLLEVQRIESTAFLHMLHH